MLFGIFVTASVVGKSERLPAPQPRSLVLLALHEPVAAFPLRWPHIGMKAFVGVTDDDWYRFLGGLPRLGQLSASHARSV